MTYLESVARDRCREDDVNEVLAELESQLTMEKTYRRITRAQSQRSSELSLSHLCIRNSNLGAILGLVEQTYNPLLPLYLTILPCDSILSLFSLDLSYNQIGSGGYGKYMHHGAQEDKGIVELFHFLKRNHRLTKGLHINLSNNPLTNEDLRYIIDSIDIINIPLKKLDLRNIDFDPVLILALGDKIEEYFPLRAWQEPFKIHVTVRAMAPPLSDRELDGWPLSLTHRLEQLIAEQESYDSDGDGTSPHYDKDQWFLRNR